MQTLSREFLLTMISMLSASWFGATNRACEACCVNSPEPTPRWRMIWLKRRFCVRTRISAAFAEKLVFRPGFIALLTIVSGKMRAAVRSLSGSMKNNYNPNGIRRRPILV